MVISKTNNHIQLLNKNKSRGSKNSPRRGVAPVIATLLLVAIAVVGGSIIFVFGQAFFLQVKLAELLRSNLLKL